ncbi:MAG TPA: hypothetical protein VHF69_00195 [Candidatus Synoicihabitans sp.]|nr:hypothetical protein [Candidatus Synoicihabitans sp.]
MRFRSATGAGVEAATSLQPFATTRVYTTMSLTDAVALILMLLGVGLGISVFVLAVLSWLGGHSAQTRRDPLPLNDGVTRVPRPDASMH